MYTEQFRAFMDAHVDEMLEDLKTLIAIPSERGEAMPGMPFGSAAADAVAAARQMMERYGLIVKNYDNYVVAGDLNTCPKHLDILAHLDVVPAGEGWTVTDAYTPVIAGGKIYGRGASDDKGPAIAALYAMRAVRELGLPLTKNVRLVLGSDEECGSSDLDYYYEREPEAPLTFSPDADFPVINVEKGGLHSSFTKAFKECSGAPGADPVTAYAGAASENHTQEGIGALAGGGHPHGAAIGGVRLMEVCAGTKINVVPGKARALVAGVDLEALRAITGEVEAATGIRFELESPSLEPDGVSGQMPVTEITALGRFAHAASPETGNNALTALVMVLGRLPFEDAQVREAFEFICQKYPHGDFYGKALGVAMADEISGPLTMSLNMLTFKDHTLTASFDCRAPLCANDGNTRAVIQSALAEGGFCLDERKMYPAHYVPADSPFVKTLLSCYSDVTGKPGKTLAIGGGTYVHDLKRGVAFGCSIEGVDNHMHGADEFMDVDHLKECAVIFAEAIRRLCSE